MPLENYAEESTSYSAKAVKEVSECNGARDRIGDALAKLASEIGDHQIRINSVLRGFDDGPCEVRSVREPLSELSDYLNAVADRVEDIVTDLRTLTRRVTL